MSDIEPEIDEAVYYRAGWVAQPCDWMPPAVTQAELDRLAKVEQEWQEQQAEAAEPQGIAALFPSRARTPEDAVKDMFAQAAHQSRREAYRQRKAAEREGAVRLPDPPPAIPVAEVRRRKIRGILARPVPKPPPREASRSKSVASTLNDDSPPRVISRTVNDPGFVIR